MQTDIMPGSKMTKMLKGIQNLIPIPTSQDFCNLGTENGYTFHPQKIPPYNAFGMCNPFYIGPILPSGILPYEIGWYRLDRQR